jgi:hypothetical protein
VTLLHERHTVRHIPRKRISYVTIRSVAPSSARLLTVRRTC